MARVSLQGSDVEGKIESNVGSGDIRLLRAKVVLASLLCKAAMSSARQRCGGKKEMSNVGRGKEQQQLSDVEASEARIYELVDSLCERVA